MEISKYFTEGQEGILRFEQGKTLQDMSEKSSLQPDSAQLFISVKSRIDSVRLEMNKDFWSRSNS